MSEPSCAIVPSRQAVLQTTPYVASRRSCGAIQLRPCVLACREHADGQGAGDNAISPPVPMRSVEAAPECLSDDRDEEERGEQAVDECQFAVPLEIADDLEFEPG